MLRTEKSLQKNLAGFAQFFFNSHRIKTENGGSKSYRIFTSICNATANETATIHNGMDCILFIGYRNDRNEM